MFLSLYLIIDSIYVIEYSQSLHGCFPYALNNNGNKVKVWKQEVLRKRETQNYDMNIYFDVSGIKNMIMMNEWDIVIFVSCMQKIALSYHHLPFHYTTNILFCFMGISYGVIY